jgi:hypothetical protein
MVELLANSGSIGGKLLSNGSPCTYSPALGEKRYVRLQMTPATDGVTRTISPLMPLESVPSAMLAERAESLQGLSASDVLQVNTSGSNVLSQSNLESIFSSSNFSNLSNLLSQPAANYIKSGSNGSAILPVIVGNPASGLATGQIWYDSAANVMKYYDGGIKTLGTTSSGVTSIVAGTGLTGGTITSTGTIAVDVGTTAGKILQVASGNKLPAIDGSNLTNVLASSLAGPVSTQNIQVWNSGSTSKATLLGANIVSDYSLNLPSGLPVSSGQILSSDTSGNLSWVSAGQSTSLANGAIWIGNASNVATAAAPSGDVSMSNSGVFAVDKIKGTTVSAVPTSSGQVLKYNGSNAYTPGFIGVADVRSTVAGNAQFFPTNCTASQTLVWQAPSDVMACTNISVSASNFANQSQNAVFAGPASGGAGAPSFRSLASTDLPLTGASGVFVNGGNSFGQAAVLGSSDNNSLTFKTNNTSRMVISSSGLIGTGGVAPTNMLDLNSAVSSVAGRTISVNASPVLYLPEQGTSLGQFDGSMAVGNGLRSLSNTSADEGRFNTSVGIGALSANTIGEGNTAVGNNAMAANVDGGYNTAVGTDSLKANVDGVGNAAFGYGSLALNTSGFSNSALGEYALTSNTTGGGNTGLGNSALGNNTTGSLNTAIGGNALYANTTASGNTAVGSQSLGANTTGSANVAVGSSSLSANTTGGGNTGVGYWALKANTTGQYNTAHGFQALKALTTASNNTAIGYSALFSSTTGADNTAIGFKALNTSTSGGRNIGIGSSALFAATSASSNTSIGTSSSYAITTGTRNTAVGDSALAYDTTGSDNVAIGYAAALGTGSTGVVSSSVFIGSNAGYNLRASSNNTVIGASAANALTTGSNNTLVGATAGNTLTTGGSNILIGNGVQATSATSSNQLNIGNTIYGDISANKYVGIGVVSPVEKLDVNGNIKVAKNSAQPYACDASHDGVMALTSQYTTCVCKGGSTAWVRTTDGSTACTW